MAEKVTARQWIALMGAMLGAFMAVLDIQITNASLNDISGALGSSLDEGSWISTAYLVAEIVVIGATGWVAKVLSLKRYLLFSAIGFTIFSVLCAFSTDLNQMIVCRALQGLTGGAIIPLALSLVRILLPPSKQSVGMAVFAMTATLAPALGPTVGGWLTDSYGWQWIFFINFIPGLALVVITMIYLDPPDQPQPELLKEGDYFGLGAMAIGLGSLEFVLEEGERKDWFGNPVITRFAVIAAVFIVLFLVIELTRKKPFVNLRLLKHVNFLISCTVLSMLGLALYGTVYILPLYLAQVQHYNAMQIGLTIMWAGLPQLFILPFVPRLMKHFDVRLIIGAGLGLFAASCFMNAHLDPDYAMDQFRTANIIRALGQPLVFVPLLTISMVGIPKQEAGSASALFNMTRNIGGSVGIAMLSTLVTQREHFHSVHFGEAINAQSAAYQGRLDALTALFIGRGLDPATAGSSALKSINTTVQTQSYIEAYSDAFYIIGVALLLAGIGLFFLPKIDLHAPASEAHPA